MEFFHYFRNLCREDLDGIGVVADTVFRVDDMFDKVVVHRMFGNRLTAMDTFLWPFGAFAHMLFIGLGGGVAVAMDASALVVFFQKMFLFFLEGDIFRTTKTLETLRTFRDMVQFFVCLVVQPAVPARDGPVGAFQLDVMIQLVLGALETTALIVMKTWVILLAVMGHHEEILLVGIDRRQLRTPDHGRAGQAFPGIHPVIPFLIELEVLSGTRQTNPGDGITGGLTGFIPTRETDEPHGDADILMTDTALDIHQVSFLQHFRNGSKIIFLLLSDAEPLTGRIDDGHTSALFQDVHI